MPVSKQLSLVEAAPNASNQHEFHGIVALQNMLGRVTSKVQYQADFTYNDLNKPSNSATATGTLTWYDARLEHPTRSEHRLYFTTNAVMTKAKEGDTIEFDLLSSGRMSIVVTP